LANSIYVVSGDKWKNEEKKTASSAVSIANARRCSGVEYAQILESLMEVVEMHYGVMMESSRKLESLPYIYFCYGGLQRIFSRLPSSLLCQNVMGKQRLIWPTGDTFGI